MFGRNFPFGDLDRGLHNAQPGADHERCLRLRKAVQTVHSSQFQLHGPTSRFRRPVGSETLHSVWRVHRGVRLWRVRLRARSPAYLLLLVARLVVLVVYVLRVLGLFEHLFSVLLRSFRWGSIVNTVIMQSINGEADQRRE